VTQLDASVLGAPVLDPRGLDQGAARRDRYVLDAAGNVVARLWAMAARIVPESARNRDSDPVQSAERICAAVFDAITYRYGITSVTTTAAEALAAGYSVCQDFAHVMLALCHLAGLPARYVSGHLLGQGGTHAWVEVIVPRAGRAEAVAFDP
jgi:transglutaminase-like putative cysteine protease